MELVNLTQHDFTGTDPDYKRVGRFFAIFQNQQLVHLEEPVYPASIKVWKVSRANQMTGGTSLVRDSDWSTRNEYAHLCTDIQATSEAMVLASKSNVTNWTGPLVNKLCITSDLPNNTPYFIRVEYQAWRKDTADVVGDSDGPNYTPGLMRTVLLKLAELEINIQRTAIADSESGQMEILEQDLTGYKPSNFIEDEKHRIDTSQDLFVIRPRCGSFYRHDLSVVLQPSTGPAVTLRQETGDGHGDYEVIGVNYAKTSISEPSSGVYEFIVVKTTAIGDVYVTYHAFGGEITVLDINQIMGQLASINTALQNDKLLTAYNLGKCELIGDIQQRLSFLEDYIRHYRRQYFTMKLYNTGVDYTKIHTAYWVNLAYITSDPWSESAPIPAHADGKFHVAITANGAAVDVDLEFSYQAIRESADNTRIGMVQLTPKVINVGGQTTDLNRIGEYYNHAMIPRFRVVYNAVKNGTVAFTNGVMLQMQVIGHKSTTTAAVMIEDRTAALTPWRLVDNTGYTGDNRTPATEKDGKTTSINGASWAWAETARSSNYLVATNAYRIFAGCVNMTDIQEYFGTYGDDSTAAETTPANTPTKYFCFGFAQFASLGCAVIADLSWVTAIRVLVYDHQTQQIRTATSPISWAPGVCMGGGVGHTKYPAVTANLVYYPDDMSSVDVFVSMCAAPALQLRMLGHTGTNSLETDRFSLIAIDLCQEV